MGQHRTLMCKRCKKDTVEVIEDWVSTLCPHCADVEADKERDRQEWNHYHPSED